jgi:hypothetical protein
METSASFEARSAPSSYPTGLPSPSEELGTAVRGKRASAGAGEVGVPQYERGSGGTDPRDPAEQRAAPGGVGTTQGNDGRDTELTHPLNETRVGSRTGKEDEGEALTGTSNED